MTPEFGAASQLEKIDMLDFADAVAINKFERRGAEDALRDVGRQLVRNREAFGASWADMPVFGTSAAAFDDDGVTALYHHLRDLLAGDGLPVGDGRLARPAGKTLLAARRGDPAERVRYLAEIAETVRRYHADTAAWAELARRRQHLRTAHEVVGEPVARGAGRGRAALPAQAAALLDAWPRVVEDYSGDELVVAVRDRELRTPLTRETLSGSRVRAGRAAAAAPTTATCCGSCAGEPARPLPVHRRACSRSSARARTRRGCSPARATRSAPTGGSTCCPSTRRPSGCRRRSTR